eukprot:TRINITY_DN12783_c0_g1_i1.p1 TRINITY_DN12783_c0_g1~~TRINITY_DN12783_c0_g1_i1.p1  ORF type:complete len:167 (+),score=10.16 TRINITY_DN12783_c0_g1_i1:119-619(+)
MPNHSLCLRGFALLSLILGIVGVALSITGIVLFALAYVPHSTSGYLWCSLLMIYLVPSLCVVYALQLSIEVAFNCHTNFWICGLRFRYTPSLARLFVNLCMITASVLFIQILSKVLSITKQYSPPLDDVSMLRQLLTGAMFCTCTCAFITSTGYLHLRTSQVCFLN